MMHTYASKNLESPTGYSGQTNPQPKLKPCPFCGSDAIAWDRLYPHVRCSNHECEVAIFRYTIEEAIEIWNRRVKE